MSLVNWKKKLDKYKDDGDDEDDDECKGVKFSDSLKDVKFIKNDRVNAKAMEVMGGKWQW